MLFTSLNSGLMNGPNVNNILIHELEHAIASYYKEH